MTRAEILEKWPTMRPRERDFVVADALGWTDIRRTGDDAYPYGWGFREATEDDRDDEEFVHAKVPHYSTSWADAGPLLEALAMLLGVCWVELDAPDQVEQWAVELHDDNGDDLLGCPFGETACDAIALAYVLAKAEA